MQCSRSLMIALTLFALSCVRESPPEHSARPTAPASTSQRHPVRVPELILLHWPSLGFKTSVSIYHNADGYKLVAERWLDVYCSKKWSRRVKPSQEPVLAEILTILDPHDMSVEDPCRVPVRDGTSWSVMADIAKHRISRTRQTTGDERCATFQAASEEIMALMGLTCTGRGCFFERELRDDAEVCP